MPHSWLDEPHGAQCSTKNCKKPAFMKIEGKPYCSECARPKLNRPETLKAFDGKAFAEELFNNAANAQRLMLDQKAVDGIVRLSRGGYQP